jgi:enoyl-CoA hydratase
VATGSANPLLVSVDRDVLRVVINRPEKRNALSLALLGEIGETFSHHADAAELKCAIVTASGERCFAAGGDLHELQAVRSAGETVAMSRLGRGALDAIRRFPLPVVAALNGDALGGGAELAMACDLRVARPGVELGFLQAQLNVTTAWGGGIDLLAAVGAARAIELLTHARRIGTDEALALGLLHRVCAGGETLDACVEQLIQPMLARPAQVLRAIKSLIGEARLALHERLAANEERGFTSSWTHEDHWTAAARALAPRTP